jgi:hypothetical protein
LHLEIPSEDLMGENAPKLNLNEAPMEQNELQLVVYSPDQALKILQQMLLQMLLRMFHNPFRILLTKLKEWKTSQGLAWCCCQKI